MQQLPHDEVIQRYEAGELVPNLCEALAEAGFQVSHQEVEAILDAYGVIRHATAFEVPESAPRGFSASELPRFPARWPDEEIRRVSAYLQGSHAGDLNPFIVDEQAQMGRVPGSSSRVRKKSAPHCIKGQRSATSSELHRELSPEELAFAANRHAEGAGETIASISRNLKMSQQSLYEQMRVAGYQISSRSDWERREMERLTPDILLMWHEGGATLEAIVDHLRNEYGLSVSIEKVIYLLRRQGLEVPAPPRRTKK